MPKNYNQCIIAIRVNPSEAKPAFQAAIFKGETPLPHQSFNKKGEYTPFNSLPCAIQLAWLKTLFNFKEPKAGTYQYDPSSPYFLNHNPATIDWLHSQPRLLKQPTHNTFESTNITRNVKQYFARLKSQATTSQLTPAQQHLKRAALAAINVLLRGAKLDQEIHDCQQRISSYKQKHTTLNKLYKSAKSHYNASVNNEKNATAAAMEAVKLANDAPTDLTIETRQAFLLRLEFAQDLLHASQQSLQRTKAALHKLSATHAEIPVDTTLLPALLKARDETKLAAQQAVTNLTPIIQQLNLEQAEQDFTDKQQALLNAEQSRAAHTANSTQLLQLLLINTKNTQHSKHAQQIFKTRRTISAHSKKLSLDVTKCKTALQVAQHKLAKLSHMLGHDKPTTERCDATASSSRLTSGECR